MTTTQILQWIKTNLGPIIKASLEQVPGVIYTEDWLAAIACRETGELIARYPTNALTDVAAVMRGDFNQREGDPYRIYHGYGFWQIDVASFPVFVRSGDWKDPAKTCRMAISVLEDKRKYIHSKFPDLAGDPLERAITAAYNCGEGNVVHVLDEQHDIDIRTTGKNYSANVWQFREAYKNL